MSTDFVKDFNIILSEYEKTNGITLDELNSDLKVKTAIERMKELSKVYDEVITDEEHLILSKENFISSLKDRNYTYDQLLELIASMAIIEELNKQKTDLLEAEIKVITLANSAITDLMQDKDKATNYLLELNEVQSQFNSTGAKLEGYKKGRDFQKIYQARNAVKAKLAKDPKQLAKIEITQCYDAVKEKFKRHGYSAQFTREMKDKYPVITAIKTIENWVTKLNKANKQIPSKPAKKVLN